MGLALKLQRGPPPTPDFHSLRLESYYSGHFNTDWDSLEVIFKKKIKFSFQILIFFFNFSRLREFQITRPFILIQEWIYIFVIQ